jgi:hypothetical protein
MTCVSYRQLDSEEPDNNQHIGAEVEEIAYQCQPDLVGL